MSKLTAAQAKALRAAIRKRPPRELQAAFGLIRAQSDHVLLAAIAPAKKRAKKAADPLARDLEKTLKPIIAPAYEKANLLVEHIAKKHRRNLALTPKGLADAARQLRAKFSDEQISAGAKSLMAHLAKLYGERETVL
jgi:hypothetical protein